MTLYQLLHIISYAINEDDTLFNHFASKTEDKDIGDVWWYVLAFKYEYDPDTFKDNPYQIYYTSQKHQDYTEVERMCIAQDFTDIYTQILIKNQGS